MIKFTTPRKVLCTHQGPWEHSTGPNIKPPANAPVFNGEYIAIGESRHVNKEGAEERFLILAGITYSYHDKWFIDLGPVVLHAAKEEECLA